MLVLTLLSDSFAPDSKILSISLRKDTGKTMSFSLWNYSSQEEMLKAFLTYFLAENDKILTGFNILKFDLPLIHLSSNTLPTYKTFFTQLNRCNISDLFPLLTSLNQGQLKPLNFYCEKFNLKPPASREELLKLYHSQAHNDLTKALEETTASVLALSNLVRTRLNQSSILEGK